jgi:signal transduction histidine kinase
MGTLGALYVLSAGSTELRRWTPTPEVSNDEATNIVEDENGDLWVSMGPRLLRIVDGVRLRPDPRVDTFDWRDGFRGPVHFGAAFRSSAREIVFGGFGGLTSFWPGDMRRNETPPQVVLTDIHVLNRSLRPCVPGSPLSKSVYLTDSLTLTYDDTVVTFSFAALNFSLPQKNRYQYKLEGFDRWWSEASSKHEATYTNLSPGAYTFRVRAANNDGVWNESGTSLHLRVTPPFWATWWFRAAGLAAIVGWALSVHRSRLLRLAAEARELTEKMEERTRLARELHDTLEQALAGIRLQLSVALESARALPPHAAESLELARRMLAYCIEEARRAVMDLRSQALEKGDLVRALREQARQLTEGTPVQIDVAVKGRHRRLVGPVEHQLFRIAQEGMTNAVKHSGGDHVDIELSYEPDAVTLTIHDNGRGLAVEVTPPGHFGLQGMIERAQRVGGFLVVENAPEGGLRIKVTVADRPDPRSSV